MRPRPVRQATFEEFLSLEAQSQVRHELVDGFMFAMAGGTDYHNRLSIRFLLLIFGAVEQAGCEVFAENMLLRIGNGLYYPDVFVTCDEPLDGSTYKRTACLVVEVLSDSTEAVDRGEKLHNYQQLSGLKAYVLVSQNHKRIEMYSRMEDGGWRYKTIDAGTVQLPCANIELNLDDLYQGIAFASHKP
jgi:Uma2 family endonuclease